LEERLGEAAAHGHDQPAVRRTCKRRYPRGLGLGPIVRVDRRSSTACDGAIAWITANWPMPGRRKFTDGDGIDIGKPTVVDPQLAASGAAQGLQRPLERPPSR
jgi:hypothetical protein